MKNKKELIESLTLYMKETYPDVSLCSIGITNSGDANIQVYNNKIPAYITNRFITYDEYNKQTE